MRMLFVPERHERGFDPMAKRLKSVDTGMASCAQRDEISSSVDPWPGDGGPQASARTHRRGSDHRPGLEPSSRWPAKWRRE
jgi:hypothetical protein